MIIIFTRHGETEFGRKERMEGHSDSPLSQKGKKQAQALAGFCKELGVKKIYSSPLGRAYTTAREVANICNLDVNVVDTLREICYGEWDGKVKKELKKAGVWEKREKHLFNFVHPGECDGTKGESYKILFKRVEPFFKRLTEEEISPILVVAHGGVVRAARKYFEKADDRAAATFRLPNNKAYIVELDDGKISTRIVEFTS